MSKHLKPKFDAVMKQTAENAQAMSAVLIDSQFGVGGYLPSEQRDASIISAAEASPLFASMGEHGAKIALIGASAIRQYEIENGSLPSNEMLASAHSTLENLFAGVVHQGADSDQLLASLNPDAMSTTKGIEIRANTAAITLPSILMNPMNDAITYLPNPRKGETEIFNVERVAGSTFGALAKGDILDSMSTGKYTQLRQRFDTTLQPDGTRTTFTYTSETDGMSIKTPFVAGLVRIYLDRKLVATDIQRNGKILGTAVVGGNDVTVSGDVDYALGKITGLTFGTAPATGQLLTIGFDVDIEQDGSLIPSVDHKMESFIVHPSQRVVAADASIMAMFAANTEFNINQRSLNLASMRNTVTDEKARNQLADIYWATTELASFDASVAAGNDWRVEFEKLRAKLTGISTTIMNKTKESGLVGMYCGKDWSNLIKSLPSSMFTFVAGYKQKPSIHFVGILFGTYRIYEVPQESIVPADEFVGYGKSDKLGRAGYITGDVIPPTLYSHEVTKGLRKGDTLWAYGYDEMHPRDGADFFVKCTLNNYTMG